MLTLCVSMVSSSLEVRMFRVLVYRWILIAVTVILASLLALRSEAADTFTNFHLDEVSLDYKNFAWINDHARNSLIYPEHPKESINLNIDTTFLSYFLWNSTIESLTTDGQYRGIGLETRIGVRLSEAFDVSYYHHSQHLIDRQHSFMDRYPVEDAIEIKFYLLRKDTNKESLF